MVLSDLRIGQCARIVRVNGGGELRRRLLDMGLTPNTIVKLVRVAPLGDPIELCLRGYNLSLREEAASDIEVELLPTSPCVQQCQRHGICEYSNSTFLENFSVTDTSAPHPMQSGAVDNRTCIHQSLCRDQLMTKRKRRRWQRNR